MALGFPGAAGEDRTLDLTLTKGVLLNVGFFVNLIKKQEKLFEFWPFLLLSHSGIVAK